MLCCRDPRFSSWTKPHPALTLPLKLSFCVDELWSLFAWINPGLLGSREHFGRRFVTPIERNRDASAIYALRALIRPFMLRRTKSAVLSELPPRTEVTLEIDLPEDERAFYEAMRQRALEALAELSEKGGGQNCIHILAEITKLRRACCHPGLIDAATTLSGASSRRSSTSSTTSSATSIRRWSSANSSASSNACVRRFCRAASPDQSSTGDSSLGARKAGRGLPGGEGRPVPDQPEGGRHGADFTAADYVIHLDPWVNPAVEDQASDRAHRIGQQRPVTVYRLIVRDFIEEKYSRPAPFEEGPRQRPA